MRLLQQHHYLHCTVTLPSTATADTTLIHYFGVIHTLNKASTTYRQLMGEALLKQYQTYERDYVESNEQEAYTKVEFESAIPMKSLVKAHDVLKRKEPTSMKTLITRCVPTLDESMCVVAI